MADDIVTRLMYCTDYDCDLLGDAVREIERLRRLADDLYETGDHQASCPPDEECTCGFTDAAYEYNKYATELYKNENVYSQESVLRLGDGNKDIRTGE